MGLTDSAGSAAQRYREPSLDVNGNRVFRVTEISVTNGRHLILSPGDQVFYVRTTQQGQHPNYHTFVLLERVEPDD